jgi:hypothetical protein
MGKNTSGVYLLAYVLFAFISRKRSKGAEMGLGVWLFFCYLYIENKSVWSAGN